MEHVSTAQADLDLQVRRGYDLRRDNQRSDTRRVKVESFQRVREQNVLCNTPVGSSECRTVSNAYKSMPRERPLASVPYRRSRGIVMSSHGDGETSP